ncbi:uncharacterized protein JN550_012467 [Neoarthrinium moseri]|uniref:uncharacterized protein n=1 Tax=Neoarthrinium moseri TaxID=1658444 RepID=UPI001FDB0897|nr:uncharacterized protein JN550_012467 [Neoarthrinium moseri]KAI1858813.1 hypothetical protein JN550_012467 [Neoarthrinium moseri]
MLVLFAAFLAVLALWKPISATVIENRNIDKAAIDKRGIGWLVDYCDDDWNIGPNTYFHANCTRGGDKREPMYIELDKCFTVDSQGRLAVDNWRKGGMKDKCDSCSRCGDLDLDACLMCRCQREDGSRGWTKMDMDGPLFVSQKDNAICCGDWWGGPYCGQRGFPPSS